MIFKSFISSLSLGAMLMTSLIPGALAQEALPNLAVESITLEGEVLTIKVKNSSDVAIDTTEGHTYIYVDETENATWDYLWSTLSDQGFLSAQGTGTIQPSALAEGSHTVKVCVDPTQVVTESNEDDNCSEVTLTVEAEVTTTDTLPDLVVESISLSSENYLTITVENKSDVAVSNTWGHTYIYIDDMNNPAWTYSWSTLSDQGFLEAQGSGTLQPQSLSAGTHTIKVVVDPSNVVEESDEGNNTSETTLTVQGSTDESTGDSDGEQPGDTDVDDDDLGDDFEDEWNGTPLPSTYFISVSWGDFDPANDEAMKEAETTTTWNGDVSFEGDVMGRPTKLLEFEPEEDWINLNETTQKNTSFDSVIHWAHDGILFKVKADMKGDETPTLVFKTEHSTTGVEVTLQELQDAVDSGSVYTHNYGDGYQVIINIVAVQDWVKRFPDSVLIQTRIGNLDGNGSSGDESLHYNVEITPSTESVIKKAEGIMLEEHSTSYDILEWGETSAILNSQIDGHQDGVLTWIKLDDASSQERSITVTVTDNDTGTKVFEQTITREETLGTFELNDGTGNQIDIENLFRVKKMNDEEAEEFFDEMVEKLQDLAEEDADETLEDVKNDTKVMNDIEPGSWYESHAAQAIDHGFFSGYKDADGNPTGNLGPADNITRLQLLKVMFELSSKLEMGVGAEGCDPETVELTPEVDWMEEDWAIGYMQCIYNSDTELTLLTDVIVSSLDEGRRPAFRWEVIMTAFEMLEVNTGEYEAYTLKDLEGSALATDVKAMIQAAVHQGIISGYEDKNFKPFRWVNRAEMFKIVNLFYEVYA